LHRKIILAHSIWIFWLLPEVAVVDTTLAPAVVLVVTERAQAHLAVVLPLNLRFC
jgi:hypothetical protein